MCSLIACPSGLNRSILFRTKLCTFTWFHRCQTACVPLQALAQPGSALDHHKYLFQNTTSSHTPMSCLLLPSVPANHPAIRQVSAKDVQSTADGDIDVPVSYLPDQL
jgi:hypothetical protein